MSTVPYIFANQTGNIPLSQLDANFANVKASVDFATTATTATRAATVTSSAQPNITSVGSTLSVSGNITIGNVLSSGLASLTGNITGGNLLTGGLISATGNITSAANVAGGNVLATTIVSGASHIGSIVSVSANVTGGNLLTGGVISATGNVRGNGFYSTSSYSGAYTDGIVVDYVTGNGRISVGTSDGLNLYNGSTVAGNLIASFNTAGALQILAGTAVPAGGTAGAGLKMSSTSNLGIFFGSGAPTLAAAQGSLYLNTTGNSTSNRMYVNTNGSTGWTNVTTGA